MNFKSLFLIALGGFAALSEATRNRKPRNFIMVSLSSCRYSRVITEADMAPRLSRKFSFAQIQRVTL